MAEVTDAGAEGIKTNSGHFQSNSYKSLISTEEKEWEKDFILSDKLEPKKGETYPTEKIKVIIVNHIYFKDDSNYREGAEKDEIDLRAKLTSLKYNIYPKHKINLTFDDQERYIKNALADCDNYDSLIFIMMTHGEMGRLLAYDGFYDKNDLFRHFENRMIGKPKLIIINSCRVETKQEEKSNPFIQVENDDLFQNLEIKDCVLVHSTYPMTTAKRHTLAGSRLIRSLRRALEELEKLEIGDDRLVLDIFTDITRHMAIKDTDDSQIPVVSFNLTKHFSIGRRLICA